MKNTIKLSILLTVFLAACAGTGPGPTEQPVEPPAAQPQGSPDVITPVGPQPNPAILGPGDGNKSNMLPTVENAQIDTAEVVYVEGQPVLRLRGNLPSACYDLRAGVDLPDPRGLVRVAALAVLDRTLPGKNSCEPAATPFEVDLPLDNLPAGSYRLLVNETLEIKFTPQ